MGTNRAIAAIRANGATVIVLGTMAALLLLAAVVAAGTNGGSQSAGGARAGVVNQVREAGGMPGGVLGDRRGAAAGVRHVRGGSPGGVLGDRKPGLVRQWRTGAL
jgi:hypothetical protein